jgi:hypothetical protein
MVNGYDIDICTSILYFLFWNFERFIEYFYGWVCMEALAPVVITIKGSIF